MGGAQELTPAAVVTFLDIDSEGCSRNKKMCLFCIFILKRPSIIAAAWLLSDMAVKSLGVRSAVPIVSLVITQCGVR